MIWGEAFDFLQIRSKIKTNQKCHHKKCLKISTSGKVTESSRAVQTVFQIIMQSSSRSYKTFFLRKQRIFLFFDGKLVYIVTCRKKLLIVKWPSLTAKKEENKEKRFYRIGSWSLSYQTGFYSFYASCC